MQEQLVLPLKLQADITFEKFHAGANAELVQHLQQLLDLGTEPILYIWGAQACGKSHLLQASYYLALKKQKRAFYLDLRQKKELQPAVLEDLEQYDLICLDNIDAIAGLPLWEENLFYLYNRVREANTYLLITATKPASETLWHLPDLKSRLNWGLIYHLQPLTDQEKIVTLQNHANSKGVRISQDVLQYILNHYSRDMHSLMHILNVLENKSLSAHKRITIPFIKLTFEKQG